MTPSPPATAPRTPAPTATPTLPATPTPIAATPSPATTPIPTVLSDALRELPELSAAQVDVDVTDLNADGLPDVVVRPHVPGLSVVACLAEQAGTSNCRPLPATPSLGTGPLPLVDSGVVLQDLDGDGSPEAVVTYTVQGGSGWTELLSVFAWREATSPDLIFHAELVNWAGRSQWRLEPEPAAAQRQQIVLTYPHLVTQGFDHKLLNHPLGRQIWRWDGDAGQVVLVDRYVDISQSAYGSAALITKEDRLRWLTNVAESAFRSGRVAEALTACDDGMAFAAGVSWAPKAQDPDWVGWLRFRHAQSAAYLGVPAMALPELRTLASDYEGDLLGDLAASFLSGYGDGTGDRAATEAYAALQALEARVRDQFYYERPGALQFPMDVEGVLCCAPGSETPTPTPTPTWPRVGTFDVDSVW